MDYDVWDDISFQDLDNSASMDGVESFLEINESYHCRRILPSIILLNARMRSVVDCFALEPH